jgi:hypothetical protein
LKTFELFPDISLAIVIWNVDINLFLSLFLLQTTWAAVNANSWLLVILVVHFCVSIFSVYYSALRLFSK